MMKRTKNSQSLGSNANWMKNWATDKVSMNPRTVNFSIDIYFICLN